MSPTFRSLANPNYRLYAAGGVVSNVGTWMQRVAQDWLVLQLTGCSGAALGITTGLQFLPFLLLSPFAGLVADRIPKRRLLQITHVGMAVPALVLGLLAVTGIAQIWHVYVLAFVFGIAAAFDAPARQSFVSEMVGPDDLTNAVGLNSASFNAARIVGPALAGVLIAALGGGAEATGWVILVNAVSYAAPILDAAQRWTRPRSLARLPSAASPGRSAAGVALRARPARPDAGPRGRVLRRHLRPELPDDVRADGDRGVRQGRRGVRPARHVMAVGSLAGALLAARRDPRRPGWSSAPRSAFGVVEIVAGLMPTYLTFALVTPAARAHAR